MANTIIGRIQSIGETVNVSKKENAFYKRELVLNASRYDPFTGEERKNIVSMSFAQRNCEKLNGFRPGDIVEVSFVLQGREYTPQGGATKLITDVVGYDIQYHNTQSAGMQYSAAAPQPPRPAAPQPVAPAAPAAPAAPDHFAAEPAAEGAPNDLPF